MRRLLPLAAVTTLLVGGALLLADRPPGLHEQVQELEYPLRYADVIRRNAEEKGVDADLIAAVIYAESRFVAGRTSHAGAMGLMQITPDTAADIARRSGGIRFETSDLHDPELNIAYGTYHLRYLLDRYGGRVVPAIAAYNAGPGNADRWVAEQEATGRALEPDQIPFPETRSYTEKVLRARDEYRSRYALELGL